MSVPTGFSAVTGVVSIVVCLTLFGACAPVTSGGDGYVLSGSSHSLRPIVLDNLVHIYVNGDVVRTRRGNRHRLTPPVHLTLRPGDTLQLRAQNRNVLTSCELGPVYLFAPSQLAPSRPPDKHPVLVSRGVSGVFCNTGTFYVSPRITVP